MVALRVILKVGPPTANTPMVGTVLVIDDQGVERVNQEGNAVLESGTGQATEPMQLPRIIQSDDLCIDRVHVLLLCKLSVEFPNLFHAV